MGESGGTWNSSSFPRRSILGGIAAGAFGMSMPISSAALANSSRVAIAQTSFGRVRGRKSIDGVYSFFGIPYGGPTGGKNRFKPPVKLSRWSGVREASAFGPIAPQLPTGSRPEYHAFIGGVTTGEQSEDCLVLNVWTPALRDGGKRPIYVRIHGGGLTSGSGDRAMYRGHNMVRRGDIVYITMNHRLDCMGFLDLSASGDPQFAMSGNVGLLDLVAMLEWVRDNAENFGGDPDCVMIAGESGGGFKVSALLGMPSAKGLFHRAVIESGAGLTARPPADAQMTTERFLSRLGLTIRDTEKLQSIPLRDLLYATSLTFARRYYPDETPPRGWGPTIDGDVLPKPMFDPVATPISGDVPLLIGYNHDEGTFGRQSDEALYAHTDASLLEQLSKMFGSNANRIFDVYKRAEPNATASQIMTRVATDVVFGYNPIVLAERKAVLGKASTYLYRFDWPSPVLNGRFGATHGIELPFTVYNVSEMATMTGDLPQAHALAAQVSAAWISFARSGVPSAAGLPAWPAYSADNRATMLLNSKSAVAIDPFGAEVRQLWRDVPLPPPI